MKKSEPKPEKVKETTRKSTSQIIKQIAQSKDILEALGEGISIQDRTFKIIYENKVHKEEFGDHVGEYCYKVYQKREGICGGCSVALTFRDGKTHTVHREFHTDEGIGYVEITASPLRDATGKIIAGIEVVRDVTKQKNAEEQLREMHDKLEALIQVIPDLVFFKDEHGRHLVVNKSAEEFMGLSKDEIIGKTDEQLLPPDLAAYCRESDKKVIRTCKPFRQEEHTTEKSGEKIFLDTIKVPLCDKQGKVIGVVGVGRNITELKKTEKALQKREKELQEKTRNLEELSTALKVLLQKRQEDKVQVEEKVMMNIRELVKPYLEKLKKGEQDKTLKTYIDIIESNLDEIVSSFTIRLSSGHLSLTPTEIQVANLIKQGKRSKEIAELIHISPKTIAFHRENIRKKLGLQNKKTNLRTYLLSSFNTSK